MLRVCKTSQQLETEILIVPGHIHSSLAPQQFITIFWKTLLRGFYYESDLHHYFQLGSAPGQQPGRNPGCCYRSQTVNSFALSSLQSIRLYTREEVASLQDNGVLDNFYQSKVLFLQIKLQLNSTQMSASLVKNLFGPSSSPKWWLMADNYTFHPPPTSAAGQSFVVAGGPPPPTSAPPPDSKLAVMQLPINSGLYIFSFPTSSMHCLLVFIRKSQTMNLFQYSGTWGSHCIKRLYMWLLLDWIIYTRPTKCQVSQ